MKLGILLICSWISVAPAGGQEQADPPSRVARLNYLNGSVSFRSGSVEDWTAAGLNYPLTTGDHLWTDQGSRADLHVGSSIVHLNDQTAFAILNLDDRMAQISLSQGSMNVRIRRLDAEEAFEIDTPNGAISLLRPGDYRVDVNGDGSSTAVTVRDGEAEVTAGGQAFPLHARQMGRFSGTDQVAAETLNAPKPDPFDKWCMDRDKREERALRASERYVPREMIGAEDLGAYGRWRMDRNYGAVWIPSRMPGGWAPYRSGHWAYVEPWGWTWIDDAPWGFAPFHYGRWAMMGSAWGWIPGAIVARPVYAPALVAFVGGGAFSAALAVGGVGVAAWIPLGPHEVYHPGYRASGAYVRSVNVTHVANITSVTVTNVTYVNRDHVTAMRQADFAGARPVAAAAVRVPPGAVGRAQTVSVMEVRPGRESYMGRPMQPGVRVVTPPARVANQTVIVKQAPPRRDRPTTPVRTASPATNNRPPARNSQPPKSGISPTDAKAEQRRLKQEQQQRQKQQQQELRKQQQRTPPPQRQRAQPSQQQQRTKSNQQSQQRQPPRNAAPPQKAAPAQKAPAKKKAAPPEKKTAPPPKTSDPAKNQ